MAEIRHECEGIKAYRRDYILVHPRLNVGNAETPVQKIHLISSNTRTIVMEDQHRIAPIILVHMI